MAGVDGVFVLSQFHKSQLTPVARSVAVVTPNALDPSHFVDGDGSVRDERRFIYASAPNRGLEQI